MVAVVAIVLSVAVDVDGGESVRNMFVLLALNVRRCCGRCTCRWLVLRMDHRGLA